MTEDAPLTTLPSYSLSQQQYKHKIRAKLVAEKNSWFCKTNKGKPCRRRQPFSFIFVVNWVKNHLLNNKSSSKWPYSILCAFLHRFFLQHSEEKSCIHVFVIYSFTLPLLPDTSQCLSRPSAFTMMTERCNACWLDDVMEFRISFSQTRFNMRRTTDYRMFPLSHTIRLFKCQQEFSIPEVISFFSISNFKIRNLKKF